MTQKNKGKRVKASVLTAFITSPAAGGIILILASAAAILIANSSLQQDYTDLLAHKLVGMSIEHWVNDALMAIFFLLVGLEIKRELLVGELSTWSQQALPGFAALGGMIAPALIYLFFNRENAEAMAGWAIPAATDIAFTLSVLALLGSRVPVSLKIFLSALAILDDMGAVAIIAIFYTSNISFVMLAAAVLTLIVLFVMNRAGIETLWPYLLAGCALWFFMLLSGVHATIAGVLLALFVPLAETDTEESPLERLEHGLSPWVTFLILPIFGFANAGVSLSGLTSEEIFSSIPVGVALGLFIGKQVGVFGLSLLAIRTGLARLPESSNWAQLYGVSGLCGIGFTMSLFIGNLAFPAAPLLVDEVKIGVLAGSILSAIVGMIVLRLSSPTAKIKS